ncbi:MAG TPA: LLM class F420-dependent oxidoreductase [Actinomycetota bacterium]
MIRFGLQIPNFTYPGVDDAQMFERVASIATTAESAGFDSVWVMDHLYQIPSVGPRTDPMLEAYTLLGAIAARTSRVQLGTMVTGVTYRNPALLAKIVTTLDVVSSGRAILGIGAAWNDDEHDGYGFTFPPAGERLDRLEEALKICRAMFTKETPTFEGSHSRIHDALNVPRPIRASGIPILVGGGGERRTLRLVARYADACNLFGDLATIRHKLGVLERHCEDVGRDPSEITKTRLGGLVIAPTMEEAEEKGAAAATRRGIDLEAYRGYALIGDPDAVREQAQSYLDAGLDGLVFNMPNSHELDPVELAGKTLTSL